MTDRPARSLVLWMMVSLDGFIEGPNRELDWHIVEDELDAYITEQSRAAGAFLYGRRTYELMVNHWPTADANPRSTARQAEFAHIWRNKPKIVFSRTLDQVPWNTRVVRDHAGEEVAALKEQPGNDLILFGGADIASTLMQDGLIDEYRLFVHPVLLGGGTPLFRMSSRRSHLRLIDTRTFDSKVVLLRYQPWTP